MKASAILLLSAVLGACCVLAAANEPATWATAHCGCSKERAIVCGADGTSYLNKCWAECSGTTVEHEGPCGKLDADVSACECSKERALVCGADGHTYLNKCWASCVGTDVEYEGACQKVSDVSACECSKERALVCGADGHTYLNKCWAACVGTDVESEGACLRGGRPLSFNHSAYADVTACECSKERALVCGADGHTYLNKCWASCVGTDVEYEGACHKVADVSACECSKERALVCGADGHTYLNKCWASCVGTDVEYDGACHKDADVTACECSKERSLVCGADGHTYLNKCWASCVGTDFEYEGACKKVSGDTTCIKDCPWEEALVCGADGITYQNECFALCADIEIEYAGPCNNNADVSACECSKERSLVCGADGHTYLNKCWASCVGTDVEYEGACQKLADVSACECSKERALVCGADGHTYLNECWAACVGTDVTHQGPCSRALENPPCACTKERDLVCGADGHTYLNACWAACSGTSVNHDGACKKSSNDELTASCLKHCARGRAHPFCGADGETYPSQCFAECAGTDVTKAGFCGKCPLTPESKKANLACDTDGFTWYNKYWLACAGAKLAHEGACDKADVIELATSTVVPAEVAASCRASCPRGWANVICGSDGVTYPNECLANCAGADFANLGYCEKCDAPEDFAPVCDAQGFTWVNKGYLECAKAEFAHDGECEAAVSASCADSCDKRLANPICGNDDKTYASKCALDCAGVEVDHRGFCKPCATPRLYAPVCDTNDYTWVNKWALECAKAEKAHDGACATSDETPFAAAEIEEAVTSTSETPAEEACEATCDKHNFANPVCGDDNVTYPSRCAAQCAGVAVARRSTCARCPVPMIYAPVCDTRGYTWVNEYDMKCAGGVKAKDGPCGDFDEADLAVAEIEKRVTSSECQRECPRALAPVCGMNDKSYANECRMECDGVELKHEGRCAIVPPAVSGSCDDSCDKSGFARPVCAANSEGRKNYPSQCAAECAGAEIVQGGTCEFCPIPRIFAPVCDTRGYTWTNQWELKCAGGEKAKDGPCGDFDAALLTKMGAAVTSSDEAIEEAVSGTCDDSCDKSGFARPVCAATDEGRKNYPSECAAECAGAEVAQGGTCEFCPIPRIFAPVCDTRGYTWTNEWELKCAGGEKAKNGPCDGVDETLLAVAEIEGAVTSSECAKSCPRVLAPVCGMNDKSYANECRMECDGVELKHEGRCAIVPPAVSSSCDDSCDKSGFARVVCAETDEGPKNFPGRCAAQCAGAEGGRGGPCEFCPIPMSIAPVCDTKGYTWINEPEMRCAGGERAHYGPCASADVASLAADIEGAVTSSECQKACPRALAPVCGMNDKSYANECRMECDGVALKHEGRCAIAVV